MDVTVEDEHGNATTEQESGIIDTVAPTIAITNGLVLTSDATPQVSGTSNEANSIVTVTFDDGVNEIEVTTTTKSDGSWSISPNLELADAEYNVTAKVLDEAGNKGEFSADGLKVDTTPIDFNVLEYELLSLKLLFLEVGLAPRAEGTAEPGTEVYILNTELLGLGLSGLNLSLLNDKPKVIADENGNWSKSLALADVELFSGNDYYFLTVDEVGNYLVKGTENQVIDSGNISDIESSPDASIASSEFIEGDGSADDSIDLSRILGGEQTQSNEVEPLNVTLNEVISDTDDVLALDPSSESSSIAFTGDTAKTAEPATDVQSQSEEMIKKLIESGNNQIDM